MFTHQGNKRTPSHNLQIASLLSFVAGIVNVCGFLSVQRLTTNVTGHFAFFVDEIFIGNEYVPTLIETDLKMETIVDLGGNPAKTLRTTVKDVKRVWLEEGGISPSTGLESGWKHVLKHKQDFINKFGAISDEEIKDLLMSTIDNGSVVRKISDKGKESFVYTNKFGDDRFVTVYVSSNGYIIGSYASSKK
jgi:hypothetical protein